jgi:hypothetical protein
MISRSPSNRSVLTAGDRPALPSIGPVRSSGVDRGPGRKVVNQPSDVSVLEARVASKMMSRKPGMSYEKVKPVRSDRVRRFAEERSPKLNRRGRRV